MKKSLGGERIGSGNKMNIRLRHYERSTHNLSTRNTLSMGVGALYPCYCKPALRGDKFEFNIGAGVRTVPSKGAMFSTYKLQIDYYLCPVRLYTGILHNNPVRIGMKMDKVLFPQITFKRYVEQQSVQRGYKKLKFNESSLPHLLGLSGMGCTKTAGVRSRAFEAIPFLAYYDIFKNYYSNKQEDLAYVLTHDTPPNEYSMVDVAYTNTDEQLEDAEIMHNDTTQYAGAPIGGNIKNVGAQVIAKFMGEPDPDIVKISIFAADATHTQLFNGPISNAEVDGYIENVTITPNNIIMFSFSEAFSIAGFTLVVENYYDPGAVTTNVISFPLENIDQMRAALLSHHTLGVPYDVNSFNKYPYKALADSETPDQYSTAKCLGALDGLMLKTYQSDMFNNWLSSEFIDGTNGIANITRVKVEGGGFTIDSFNYAEKMYDLLNRIIVSGDTYEDWQDVVYEELPKRHLESPMYIGGLSQEIVFEEIVSTTDTAGLIEGSGKGLGALGGRGISRHRKGGHIRCKVDEASFIIGIVSITPRLNYGQSNEFFFTDIFSMDDFHKPALDGIGFQDLLGERMAYFDTIIDGNNKLTRHVIGKLPAWLEYMTDVDRVHGDFADENSNNSFMVLNRNYEFDSENGVIADPTTYIDPEKYNYTFLYTERDSMNFWVQIDHNIPCRRKMSAKQIPNV